ncbi:unnamed protein product [Timema podura]|uniref:Uncharacterized protein n=1 Tax=Timema podura TaxID=61482 RepID=A0ABN7NQ15_TIMPD|nr:unnamed protein product [Timema podura]
MSSRRLWAPRCNCAARYLQARCGHVSPGGGSDGPYLPTQSPGVMVSSSLTTCKFQTRVGTSVRPAANMELRPITSHSVWSN